MKDILCLESVQRRATLFTTYFLQISSDQHQATSTDVLARCVISCEVPPRHHEQFQLTISTLSQLPQVLTALQEHPSLENLNTNSVALCLLVTIST